MSCEMQKNDRYTKLTTCYKQKQQKYAQRNLLRLRNNKKKFVSTTKGGDLTNSINKFTSKLKLPWAKFPGEMHLPGMNFAGPGTNLDERLTSTDAYQDWSKPVDRVDNAAYHHDLAYKYFNDKQTRNLVDQMMLEEMDSIQNPTQREINERKIIKPIISAKAKFGLGVVKPARALKKKYRRT